MPFEQIDMLRWSLAVDREATVRAYQHADAAGCDCAYCRNFVAAQAQLPAQIDQTLRMLGIDPARPAEIVEYTQNPDGSHFYGWWYHAVGRILAEDCGGAGEHSCAELTSGVEVGINAKDDLVPAHFPRPVIQIELFCNLPWVLP